MPTDRPIDGPGADIAADAADELSTGPGGQPSGSGDRNTGIPETDYAPPNSAPEAVTDGDSDSPDDNDADPVRAALARARGIVAGTPRLRRRDRDAARRTRRENLAGRDRGGRRGGYSGPGPDPDRDPQPIGAVLGGYVADRGWDRPLAQARVFAEWPTLVGADVAAHCAPQSLHDGELRIAAESTAWATQLRLLSSSLLARLVAELGPDVVTKLHVAGPTGPSWKHGNRSVRGARGPRDTYG